MTFPLKIGCGILVVLLILIPVFIFTGGFAGSKKVCWGDGACAVIEPVGMFEDKRPDVEYEVSVGNVIVGAIFIETAIIPIVIAGWYLWEPVGAKIPPKYHGIEPQPHGYR